MPDGVGEMGRAIFCKAFLGHGKELAFILSVAASHPLAAGWKIDW